MVDATGVLVRWLLVVSGLVVAFWLGHRFGWLGFVLGLPLGASIMLVVLCTAAVGWTFLQNVFFRGMPSLPVCRNGCCRGDRLAGPGDYKLVWNEDSTFRGFRCKCGITYQKVGPRFVELAVDGSHEPYLIWSPLKGWIPDRAVP